ncbi:MAG: hypothetical protein ABMA25_01345, partial [Ilumatobacteraceae bacterium]
RPRQLRVHGMSRYGRSRGIPLPVAIGLPVLMLAAGGAAGWFTRDTDKGGATGTPVTVVGAPLPDDLDASAPVAALPDAISPVVVDPTRIVGDDTSGAVAVPAGAGLMVPLAADGVATAVNARSLQPIDAPASAVVVPPPAEAALDQPVPSIPPTVSTLAPPDGTLPPVTRPAGAPPAFVDPCNGGDPPCAGEPGVVQAIDTGEPQPAPLHVTYPVAAAGGYAALCDAIEGGAVPDTFLPPSLRPTVAVFVNQPSTLALTGTWSDGTELEKLTMVTLPAHDTAWQQAWQDGDQRQIAACITLPLDEVRAHAAGGVATLHASVLAISATGRATTGGTITLHIPIDGDDPLFTDRLTVTDRGEQLQADGALHPTVHVHYAFLTDAVVPPGSGLRPDDVRLTAVHALIEGADCTGWAVNRQGRDRTFGGSYRTTVEQRTVAGRERTVTVVDGDVVLDAGLPGGWEGTVCVRLIASDADAVRVATLSLQGATLRSPRTAVYEVGVHVAEGGLPANVALRASWRTDQAELCSQIELGDASGGDIGATCTVYARAAPGGIIVVLTTRDGTKKAPLLQFRVPVLTAYCNPTEVYGAVGDGCNPGFVQPLELPVGDGTARVVISVVRTATGGSGLDDPSHAWRINAPTTYTF